MRTVIRAWALWSMLAVACGAPSRAREAQVSIVVSDDNGHPLAGVAVDVDGAKVATTDAHGRASALIHAQTAARVALLAHCPEGFRELAPRSLALGGATKAPLELELVCRPLERTLALVVRAEGGQGLMVRADGEPVGTIGEDGTLHALLRRPPNAEVRVVLDTTSAPKLEPQHPASLLRVLDSDEIVTIDQPFTTRKPRPARRVASRPAEPAPVHVPYPIGRTYD